MATNRLTEPKTLDDMLLYVLWQLQAAARGPVVRVCEAEFGITRREWRMLAQLGQGEGLASSALAERAGYLSAANSSTSIPAPWHKPCVSENRLQIRYLASSVFFFEMDLAYNRALFFE